MIRASANDTICALATSPSQGGVGIVRISGPLALAVLGRVAPGPAFEPYRLHFRQFVDADARPIDEGYAVFVPGPRSYTTEDVGELHGHGGSVNLSRLLRAAVRAGARPADRGEFTLRAFLGGRMDLSQAEAVLDIVRAPTETALDIAHAQLRGSIKDEVARVRDGLLGVLARLEAQIDFVEEDLDGVHGLRPTGELEAAWAGVTALLRSYRRGRALRHGMRVVLVGPPNVGKSSLFNALLRQSRAIVTDIPGTTRDFLEETADFDGLPVVLTDTAGLREDPGDAVEQAGVQRARDLAARADLVLLLTDSRQSEPTALPPSTDEDRVVRIVTKADLAPGDVSVVTGQGIDGLVSQIRSRALDGCEQGETTAAVVTSERHHEALRAAACAIERAVAASRVEPPELVALDVQEALDQLGLIAGTTTTEDLLDRIFSEFCIGK